MFVLGIQLDINLINAIATAGIFNSFDSATLVSQLEALKSEALSSDGRFNILDRKFLDELRLQYWYTALHLNPEWVELSEEEVDSLENYTYANTLMILCKEAAKE